MAKRQAQLEGWGGEQYQQEEGQQFQNKKPAVEYAAGDADGQRTARRDSKICCRFIIPSKFAGQLIGKKGAHINSLRDTYGVQIAIPDSSSSERLCRVMSEDLDSIMECVRDISVKLSPDMCTLNTRLMDGQTEMRLLVNKGQCGGIIGAKGARIKELREKTGATINMHGECCPGSTDRILQVGGEPDAVIDTLTQVISHLATLEPPAENQRYEPGTTPSQPGVHYGGIKGEGTSHPGQRDSGYMRNANDMRAKPPMGMGMMGGNPMMRGGPGPYGAMPPHHAYPPMPYGYPYPYPPNAYPSPYAHPMAGAYMPYSPYSAPQGHMRPGPPHQGQPQKPHGGNNYSDMNKSRGGFGHGTR